MLNTDSFSEALGYVCKLYDVNGASKEVNLDTVSTNSNAGDDFSKLVRKVKRASEPKRKQKLLIDLQNQQLKDRSHRILSLESFSQGALKFFGVRDMPRDTTVLRHESKLYPSGTLTECTLDTSVRQPEISSSLNISSQRNQKVRLPQLRLSAIRGTGTARHAFLSRRTGRRLETLGVRVKKMR